jgi:hypothetical protein
LSPPPIRVARPPASRIPIVFSGDSGTMHVPELREAYAQL